MSDRDVKIGIVTTADAAPIEKTEKSLDNLGEASARVTTKTTGTKKALISSEQSMSAMGAASSAASGNLTGVASAMGQLAPKLQGLSAALPYIGLATAAFAAWKKVIDTLAESSRKMRMDLMASVDDQLNNALERSTAAYARMRQEMDDTATARRALSTAEAEAAAARSRERLAEIEAERAKAKSELQPGDELGARRVDAKYDARVAAEQDSNSADQLAREKANLRAEQKLARDTERDVAERLRAKDEQMQAEQKRMGVLLSKSKAAIDRSDDSIISTAVKYYNPRSTYLEKRRERAIGEFAPSMKHSEGRLKDLAEELKILREKLVISQNQQQVMDKQSDTLRSQENQAVFDSTRGKITRKTTVAAIDADEKKARDAEAAAAAQARQDAQLAADRARIQAQRDKATAGRDPYDARVAREKADVSQAQSKLASTPRGRLGRVGAEHNFEKQIEELQAAIAARDAFAVSLTAVLAELRKKEEALANQIKRP